MSVIFEFSSLESQTLEKGPLSGWRSKMHNWCFEYQLRQCLQERIFNVTGVFFHDKYIARRHDKDGSRSFLFYQDNVSWKSDPDPEVLIMNARAHANELRNWIATLCAPTLESILVSWLTASTNNAMLASAHSPELVPRCISIVDSAYANPFLKLRDCFL